MSVQVLDAIRPFLQGALFQLQRFSTPVGFCLPVEGSGPVGQIARPAHLGQHILHKTLADAAFQPIGMVKTNCPKVPPVIVCDRCEVTIKAVLPHVPHVRKIVVSCSRMIGISLQKVGPVITGFFQRVESAPIGLPCRHKCLMAGNTVPHIRRKSAVVKRCVKNSGAVARIPDHLEMTIANAACLTCICSTAKYYGGKCYG